MKKIKGNDKCLDEDKKAKCEKMQWDELFQIRYLERYLEEMAFEMSLELYEGTKANILKENGFGRFQEQQETQGG